MIPDVTSPPLGWSVNGAAEPVAAGFQLTHAGRHDEAGSAFWNTAVDLTAPTTVEFDADLGGGGVTGADGMALVYADAQRGGSPHVVGENASAVGYGGIPGVAVILDTYQNFGEPSSNFVGIANGLDANGVPSYVAKTTAVPDLREGMHHVQIDTARNHVDVVIDGGLALSRSVTLPARAYVGFTGANGGYTDDHVVTNIRADAASGIGSIGGGTEPVARPDDPAPTPPSVPCVGVVMTGGQADINAYGPNTTFCLSGTHNWSLAPKSGDRLIGPAVLDGQHVSQFAIDAGTSSGVVVASLEIRNYTTAYQQGAIRVGTQAASGWTLQDLDVHDNGTSAGGYGAALGPAGRVVGGRYYNNRQGGIAGGGAHGATVDGAEIDHNNFTDDTYKTREPQLQRRRRRHEMGWDRTTSP